VKQPTDMGKTQAQDRPAGELVKQLSEQVSTLVRDELRLAGIEMTRKGKRAGAGAGLLGGGGVVALYAAGCLLASAIISIGRVVAPWLAALIVGAALLAVSAVMAMLGRGRLRTAAPVVPEEAVTGLKADVQEIRERGRR
jgi:uncharacterized membrane protein YqjE